MKDLVVFKKASDPTTKTVLYVFEVPHKHKEDYAHFINGEYSKFSQRYKDRILEFHLMGKDSVIGHILYKNKKRKIELEELMGVKLMKHEELHSIPDPTFEVYNPEIYNL